MGVSHCVSPILSKNIVRVKGEKDLIRITKHEMEYLKANSRNCRIAVTGGKKRSRNKKWYVDELPETLILLDKFNASRVSKGE